MAGEGWQGKKTRVSAPPLATWADNNGLSKRLAGLISDGEATQLVIEIVKKSEFTDFRGQDVAAGVYTLRYGQQPVDGNHVGTSDLADFLLAIPAKLDTDPALLKMSEAMHKLSAKTAGSNHPAIFSLLPPKADEKTPALTHDSSKHFWILSLTADGKAGDAAIKIPLRVVIVGVSEG